MRSIILAFIKANVKNALRQLRLLQWAFYRGGPVPLRTGVELYLNPKCDTSRKLFSRRSTEPELIAFLSRVIMPGALAIDVGANIGYISTHLSRCVGETGRVLAFEPDPRSFPFLKKNIELNGCKNAQAYPLGLSDKRGTDQLFLATYATGNTTLYEPTIESAGDRLDRPGHRYSESVEIIRLDDLSRMLDFKVGNIQTILKIDVEGLEIRVLMGGGIV